MRGGDVPIHDGPMRTVLIRFVDDPVQDQGLIHRLRNFGEDVFHYVRDAGRGMGEVDLAEVDSAKDLFLVRHVAASKVRRLRRWLEDEAARQNLHILTEVH